MKMRLMGIAALLTAISGQAGAIERWQLNMTQGTTVLSKEVYHLHMTIFYICCVIGALVFGAMFYAMFKFRKSKGAVAATWSHSTAAEIVWTVAPILILIVMAIPATRVLVNMYDTGNPQLTVNVTGYQWLWEYEYQDGAMSPGGNVKFASKLARDSDQTRRLKSGKNPYEVDNYLLDVDRPLILPADTKIRFNFTADDVIHAWWVPALGWKQDAIPGFVNDNWTFVPGADIPPGGKLFRGQCTELCGKDHGFMPIVVKIVPKSEWAAAYAGLQQSLRPIDQSEPKLAAVGNADSTVKSFE